MSGGVGGVTGVIPLPRPDQVLPDQSGEYLYFKGRVIPGLTPTGFSDLTSSRSIWPHPDRH